MDFKELDTFMKLIEFGTYSRTAEMLYISQPTVTVRMKSLENELGVKLLKKSGKGYRPTESGKLLVGYAERLLMIHDECIKAVSRSSEKNSRSLRIGATALGTYIIPDITMKFKKHHPDTKLFFSISNTSEAMDSLKEGIVDAVMAPFSIGDNHDDLHSIKIGHDALVLVASSSNPLSQLGKIPINRLKKESFIVREKGSNTRKMFDDWMIQNGLDSCSIAEIGQPEAIRRSVAKNAGISMLSTLSLQEWDSSISILNVEGFPKYRDFNIITHTIDKNEPTINTFSKYAEMFLSEFLLKNKLLNGVSETSL